jgi:hypothetical protein
VGNPWLCHSSHPKRSVKLYCLHDHVITQKLYPCNFPITFFLLKFPCTLLIPRDSHSSTHPLISSYYLCITFISICNNSHSPLFHKFSHKFSAISHVFFFSAQREKELPFNNSCHNFSAWRMHWPQWKLVLQDTCIADSASWFSRTTRQEAQTIFCGGFLVCRIRLSGPVSGLGIRLSGLVPPVN